EGTVLEQSLLASRDGELVELLTPGCRLWRDEGGTWRAEPRSEPAGLHPRDVATRRRAEATVVLDEHQRAAVRQPPASAMLVLGEAGFGKTTVALHRLAWLAEQRAAPASTPPEGRAWALVIVPTEGLRRLSTRLLSRLSVPGVEVVTFASFITRQARAVFPDLPPRLSRDATPLTVRLKRHGAVAQVIPALAEGTPAMLSVCRGRLPKHATWRHLLHLWGDRELLDQIRAAAGEALPPRALDEVVRHTRVQFSRTTEHAMRHVDAARLRTLDDRPIDEGTPKQDAETVDLEDFPVMFALNHAMTHTDATPAGALQTYEHVVLDEAQELAPLELAVLGRAVAPGGGLTVAGDERQQVDDSACFTGWDQTMRALERSEHTRVVLRESYRSPPAVEALARRLVAPAAPSISTPAPVSDAEALVRSRFATPLHLAVALGRALRELRDRDPSATVAVILRHPEAARRLHGALARAVTIRLVLDGEFTLAPGACVTTVEQVKGLEFAHVVVPDATAATYPDDPRSRRALYVAITRAMHQVWL